MFAPCRSAARPANTRGIEMNAESGPEASPAATVASAETGCRQSQQQQRRQRQRRRQQQRQRRQQQQQRRRQQQHHHHHTTATNHRSSSSSCYAPDTSLLWPRDSSHSARPLRANASCCSMAHDLRLRTSRSLQRVRPGARPVSCWPGCTSRCATQLAVLHAARRTPAINLHCWKR